MNNREYGRDVSYAQGGIDWTQPDQDNFGKFVIIKVGGGDGVIYTDIQFGSNRQGARDRGLKIGFYWFGGVNDPIQEADYFVNQVGELRPGEILVLDSESGAALDPNWCGAFLSHVFGLVGFHPFIYMSASKTYGHDWSGIANAGYPLWVAHYGVAPTDTVSVGYWNNYVLHQFTDKAGAGGVAGAVDADVFICDSINDWDSYGQALPVVEAPPLPSPVVLPPAEPQIPQTPVSNPKPDITPPPKPLPHLDPMPIPRPVVVAPPPFHQQSFWAEIKTLWKALFG